MFVVPFESFHLTLLHETQGVINPMDQQHLTREETELFGDALEPYENNFTGFDDGQVVGCAGFIPVSKGVASAWAYLGELTKRNRFEVTKLIMRTCDKLLSDGTFHRIHTLVKADHVMGRRWAEAMKFEQESVVASFGPNREDYITYRRLANG